MYLIKYNFFQFLCHLKKWQKVGIFYTSHIQSIALANIFVFCSSVKLICIRSNI